MTRGERIRYARLNKNMTLEDLAKACNTTKQTINKYEKGIITNIPSDKVELLAKALDITPAYIFGWEDSAQLGDLDQKIMDAFRALPDNKKLALYEFIKSIAE